VTKPRRRYPRATVVDRPLYTLEIEHKTMEALAQGSCPEDLAVEAHRLLRWQREAIRALTPEKKTTKTRRR
jgi:hypothetical protein